MLQSQFSQNVGNVRRNALRTDVAYGSVVTIKNHRPGGGYLHSHPHLYPGSGQQQQVTAYCHKDENNLWLVRPADREVTKGEIPPQFLRHGDILRLQHVQSGRNLHSHDEPAPITQRHLQVTCYGVNGTGDENDMFRLRIVNLDITSGVSDIGLKAVLSQFQLIHVNKGCAVHSHNVQLPTWGYEQMEVTCNPNLRDQRTFWNIEEVHDHRLPNVSFVTYAPTFWEKFVESHIIMFQSNAGLKAKEGEVTSSPWQWPLNYRGQPFAGGRKNRVYLLGNPVVWWTSLGGLIFLLLFFSTDKILRKRGVLKGESSSALQSCMWLLLGWALHYLPFWFMSRVLYFHHYFAAFLYSAMITAIVIDLLTEKCVLLCSLPRVSSDAVIVAIMSLFIYSFRVFSPLAYGMHGSPADEPHSKYKHLKWMHLWEI